jgi:hypothetical protein
MKKQKKFSGLSLHDLCVQEAELVKELVKYRVSMDPAVLKNVGGIAGLRRDLRTLSCKKAQSLLMNKEKTS